MVESNLEVVYCKGTNSIGFALFSIFTLGNFKKGREQLPLTHKSITLTCFLPGRGSVLTIFTITPLTNWGPVALTFSWGQHSSLLAVDLTRKEK